LKFDRKTEEPYVEVKIGADEFEKRILILGTSDGVNVEVIKGLSLDDEIKVWNKAKKSEEKGDPDPRN